jgi:hypothetical protein
LYTLSSNDSFDQWTHILHHYLLFFICRRQLRIRDRANEIKVVAIPCPKVQHLLECDQLLLIMLLPVMLSETWLEQTTGFILLLFGSKRKGRGILPLK